MIFSGALMLRFDGVRHPIPMNQALLMSQQHYQRELIIADDALASLKTKGILVVSNVTIGGAIPHHWPLVTITVFDKDQRFETFTLKAGRVTL